MRTVAVLSMLITTVVTVTVGIRLLMVARRTRQAPELLFGIAFVGGGAGQAFAQVGQRALWADSGSLGTLLNTVCFGLVVLGSLALWAVTRRVFRPSGSLAGWLCIAGALVTLAAYGLRIVDGDFVSGSPGTRGHGVHLLARCVLMGWISVEATRHYRMLRRRVTLGLADPMATNQVLMWAISGYATLAAALVIGTWAFVLQQHPLDSLLATSMLIAIVAIVSVGTWCAFFPPDALRRRVEARAAAVA